MPFLLIVLVAAVQGLTEFLPVSSSGHLALIPLITDQPYQGRAIDVAAQGTRKLMYRSMPHLNAQTQL